MSKVCAVRARWLTVIRLLCVAGSALLAASCASIVPASQPPGTPSTAKLFVTPAPNPAAQQLTGWIARFTNGVKFIQWVETDGALSGTYSSVVASINDPTNLQRTSAAFTGTDSDGSLTLTFPEGFGDVQTWVGTLSGGTLTLSFATSTGILVVDTYCPGTVADYNAGVAAEQDQVDQAQAAQASAAASAAATLAQQQQLAREQSAIDMGSQTVSSDLDFVSSDVETLQDDVSAIPDDLGSMKQDLDGTYSDMNAVLAEAAKYPNGNDGLVCDDASTVADDASTVADDESTIEDDGSSLDDDISTVTSDVTTLQADFQSLTAAEAALPIYLPTGVPTVAQVNQDTKASSDAIAQAHQTYSGYLTQAETRVETANGYSSTAQAACTKTGG